MVSKRKKFAIRALAAAVGVALSGMTLANPTGPSVVSGLAAFALQNKTLTVTNSPGAIINWQGFSIGRDELTRFMQQSAVSAVLNRVVGGNPSEILGRLWSNGRIFLINPGGITFGSGARIDVAGLVASSLQLSDADFIAGRLRFSGAGSEGSVINHGAITTPLGGSVALLGPTVENTGMVRAPSGDIILAAGKTVQLVDTAFPSIQIEVSAPADRPLTLGPLGSGNVFAYVVKQSGTLNASAAEVGDGGRIALRSAGDVQLAPSSMIAALGRSGGHVDIAAVAQAQLAGALSAKGADGPGGVVHVAAETIELASATRIDASGRTGGGVVLMGAFDPATAITKTIDVKPDVEIIASALDAGDGGRVEIIAEQAALFAGAVEARGGPNGGDGGAAEVSGKRALVFTGTVDTRAPAGRDGNLLIDPARIAIVPTSTGIPAALGDGLWALAEDAGAQSLGAANLAALLNATSVTLQASERIEVAPTAIVTAAPAASRTLTLAAPQIVIHGTFRSTGAPLNVALNAGGSGSVSLSEGSQLALAGGKLSVAAQAVSSNLASATRETQNGMVRAVNSDLAALRAQVEAEIARDNARVAQSIRSCDRLADTRQGGCLVGGAAPRKFQFAGL